jgi:hypothetical protein
MVVTTGPRCHANFLPVGFTAYDGKWHKLESDSFRPRGYVSQGRDTTQTDRRLFLFEFRPGARLAVINAHIALLRCDVTEKQVKFFLRLA